MCPGTVSGEHAQTPSRRRRAVLRAASQAQDVVFDPALRELTQRTIAETRALLSHGLTPGARYDSKRCDACSLIDLCQPRLLGRGSVDTWLRRQLDAEEE